VVARAPTMAIKRAIASEMASHPERSASAVEGSRDETLKETPLDVSAGVGEGITEQDLQMSFHAEYAENDIFPPTDITEDWLKLIDYDPEYVVKIAPVRANLSPRISNPGGVI
jgi:hypothetical protein